jgi:WD40 repeat protein
MAILWAHATEPPPAITGLRPELPAKADPVLARALAKEPGDHYPSCQDFTEALRIALDLPPYASRDADGATPPAETPAAQDAPVLASRQAVTHTRSVLPGPAHAAAPPAARQSPQPSPATRNDGAPSARHWTRKRLAIFTVACTVIAAAVIIPLAWPGTPAPHGTLAVTLAVTLADPGSQGVSSVAFSPDGKTLATADANGHVYLWNTATRHITATLTAPNNDHAFGSVASGSVAFGPDGVLATADPDTGNAHLWNTATRHITATLTGTSTGTVDSVAFGPDGTLATAANDEGSTYLWNTATGHITATLTDPTSGREPGQGINSIAFGPDGTLATADDNGSTYLWNTATRHITATLTDDPGGRGVDSVAFGPDGVLATADPYTGNAYLWNTATRHITATLPNPDGEGGSIAFGPNGTLATNSAGGNYIAYLWNTATRHITATLTDPKSGNFTSIAFGPDGTLATADDSGSTYLWKMTYH